MATRTKKKTSSKRKTKSASSSKRATKKRTTRRSAVKSLGRELLDTLGAILDLREATTDPDRSEELRELQKRLSDAASELIEANIEANTAQYEEARASLVAAETDIRDATRGLVAVVDAIASVGRAIQRLDALAGLA